MFTKPPRRRKKGSFQASGAASTKPKPDCARGTGTSSSPRQPAAICKEHRGTYGCNPQEVSAGGHPLTSARGLELRHASHVLAHIPASQPVTPDSPAPGPASWLQLQPRGPEPPKRGWGAPQCDPHRWGSPLPTPFLETHLSPPSLVVLQERPLLAASSLAPPCPYNHGLPPPPPQCHPSPQHRTHSPPLPPTSRPSPTPSPPFVSMNSPFYLFCRYK